MAMYDNRHWLLSNVRNSFMSSDDTGLCEMMMLGEDIPRQLSGNPKFDCYLGADESDDEEDDIDAMSHSFDIQTDYDYSLHRQRSNTAQRLEKMELEKKKRAQIRHVKWEHSSVNLSDADRANLFERKDFRKKKQKNTDRVKKHSILAEQLEKSPSLPQNPFQEYAKYDGTAQVGLPTRKFGIFLTMLPESQRNYPLTVVVLANAKVQDLIGLICWKFTIEHGTDSLKDSAECYSLYIAEDDGEVDWDFPCVDPKETAGKFGFPFLALVERKYTDFEKDETDSNTSVQLLPILDHVNKSKGSHQDVEDDQIKNQMTAMEAPLYQSYQVYIINKMRTKTEIHLGISGEKVEIDPVAQQKGSAKFWNWQKAVTYDIDSIAACDLTDTKSSNRVSFRLVYYHAPSSEQSQTTYKHHDFEADHNTAEEIVQKINHILELRSSVRRKEYLTLRERKSHRRKSFHLGPR